MNESLKVQAHHLERDAYLARSYGLRSRYDRLRARGMLTKKEMAAPLLESSAKTRHVGWLG